MLEALAELQNRIHAAEDQNIRVEIRATVRSGAGGLPRRTVLEADMVKHLTIRGPEIVVNVVRAQKLDRPHQWAGMDYSKIWPDGTKEPATYMLTTVNSWAC